MEMGSHRGSTRLVETLIACAGLALLLFAWVADKHWLDEHVLPHMFLTRSRQLLWWQVERTSAVVLGLFLLLLVRPWAGRMVRSGRGREIALQAFLCFLAALLSVAVSESVLRAAPWRGVDRWAASEEPLRQVDGHLGWINKPARTGVEDFGGRHIFYHFDAGGHRIPDPSTPVAYDRPAILFTGESIMAGFRLNWRETLPGLVQAATGVQSANLAVNGYGTDQSYMRLAAELPRYREPLAVVALFTPTLVERNLETDRPHLDSDLLWHPATPYWRVLRVLKNAFLYRRRSTIENGVATTRAVLAATVRDARARGAIPLILVPSFSPEPETERRLRRHILDEAGLPYVLVPLDPRWRIAGDGHPDAEANRVMAEAVLAALVHQGRLNLRPAGEHSQATGAKRHDDDPTPVLSRRLG
jgi:hypothetical protein